MQSRLTYKGIGNVLLERFPELQEEFGKVDLKAEASLAYPLFEGFFKGFVFNLLDLNKNSPLVSRVFAFLEEMANSQDKEVVNLLWITILEYLVFDRERLTLVWKD